MVSLTDSEKKFLIGCILMGAEEGFYIFERSVDDGSLKENEIVDLMKRLGASKDQIDIFMMI